MRTLFFFVTHEDLQQPASDPELVLLIISGRQSPAEYGTEDQQQSRDQFNHLRPPPAHQCPPAEPF